MGAPKNPAKTSPCSDTYFSTCSLLQKNVGEKQELSKHSRTNPVQEAGFQTPKTGHANQSKDAVSRSLEDNARLESSECGSEKIVDGAATPLNDIDQEVLSNSAEREAAFRTSGSTTITHSGLPQGSSRTDLLNAWDRGARHLGISKGTIQLGRWLILRTNPRHDYDQHAICAVWTGTGEIAAQLGVSPRSINNAEQNLKKLGFIHRTGFANGKRYGSRCPNSGKILWAAGVNLAPMVDRFVELVDAANAADHQKQEIDRYRAEIRLSLREITASRFEDLKAIAAEILPRRRPSEISCIEKLKNIFIQLRDAIEEAFHNAGRKRMTDQPENFHRPYTKIKQTQKPCTRQREPKKSGIEISPSRFWDIASSEFQQVIKFCNEALATGSNPRQTDWRTISTAAREQASLLGICQIEWQRAEERIGGKTAALCLLIVDQNSRRTGCYRVQNPARAFCGLARKCHEKSENLSGLIGELSRAMQLTPGTAQVNI